MKRLLLVACGALASHSGFVTRGAEGRRLCGGGGGGGGGSLSPEECVLGAPREGTAYLCASRADATKANNYCFASWAFVDKDGTDLKIVADGCPSEPWGGAAGNATCGAGCGNCGGACATCSCAAGCGPACSPA